MTQDTTGTSLQHSEKPQLPRQSAYLSSITRTYLVLALTVAILGTLLASSVGRGLAFRGLSSIRYPVYGAERNLRSYASFGRNSFEQHTAVSENEMASITKAKAEDCATGKAETKLTPAEEARWNRCVLPNSTETLSNGPIRVVGFQSGADHSLGSRMG